MREKIEKAVESTKNWWNDFPYKLPLYVGLFGLITSGILFHMKENQREHKIPIAFSEISRLHRENPELLHINLYLAAVNDFCAKIFEAYNKSEDVITFSPKRFATELEYHIDPTYKWTKFNIPSLAKIIDTLKGPIESQHRPGLELMEARALAAQASLAQVWHYDRDDHYHTVYSRDSKGRSTSRRVYDYSDHEWRFDNRVAFIALNHIAALKPVRVDYHPRQSFKKASQVGPENEVIMDKFVPIDEDRDRHTQAEYDSLAISWIWGSTYLTEYPSLETAHRQYRTRSDLFSAALLAGKDYKVRTYSQTRPAYMPYDMTMEAHASLLPIISKTNALQMAIYKVPKELDILEADIYRLIGVTLDGKPDPLSGTELSEEVIDRARSIYATSFDHGFNVRGYSGAIVLFSALLIGSIFGGTTAFLQRAQFTRKQKSTLPSWALRK